MKTVSVNVTVKIDICIEDGMDIIDILDGMDYSFTSDDAEITETEITDYSIVSEDGE